MLPKLNSSSSKGLPSGPRDTGLPNNLLQAALMWAVGLSWEESECLILEDN